MYDYDDKPKGQDLLPPDAVIRLASVVHRFRCPEMGSKKLSYVKSFKSASTSHETSQALMREVRWLNVLSDICVFESLQGGAGQYAVVYGLAHWVM